MGIFDNIFDKCYICHRSDKKLHRIDVARFICVECFKKQERRGKRKSEVMYTPASDAICPYCKRKLVRVPRAKTQCPSCKQFIYVGTVDRNDYAVTEEQKREIVRDKANENRRIASAIAKKYRTDSTQSKDTELFCPYCFSRKVFPSKKGFGIGKALTGGVLAGPVGLFGGFIGSNQTELVCLKCGKHFKPF